MKPGTPAGRQLWRAEKAILPARTSSLSFFICSFTNGFRFGLERSAIRKVGCSRPPLLTKGCAGSLATGGTVPATASKSGPPWPTRTQPYWADEKFGGDAFSSAAAGATGVAQMNAAEVAA